jgi:hypothetical protein
MTRRAAARRVCRPHPEVPKTKIHGSEVVISGMSRERGGGLTHDGLEEHDSHETTDTAHTVECTDENGHEDADGRVDGEEDWRSDDGKKGNTDESTDGEHDKTV